MRTLGFARVAAAEVRLLRDETREALQAFADGVNKFLEQHGDALPVEFVLLGYRPERWSPTDSILIGKLQVFDAAGNETQELLRADLALRLGTGALATLMPDPAGRSATVVDERAWSQVAPLLSAGSLDAGVAALRAILPGAGAGVGSNCWALSGAKTTSGRPILAGDPHLGVRNPSIWYEIGLEGAGYKLVGFSLPGIPAIVLGHNDRIAWSLTYAYADTMDLFVERADPRDPRRYEYRGGFEMATFVREEIKVKGRLDPVLVDVAITRHGPTLSGARSSSSATGTARSARTRRAPRSTRPGSSTCSTARSATSSATRSTPRGPTTRARSSRSIGSSRGPTMPGSFRSVIRPCG